MVDLVHDQQPELVQAPPGHRRRVVGHHRDRPDRPLAAADDADLILRHAGLLDQAGPPLAQQLDRRHDHQRPHRHLLERHERDDGLAGPGGQDHHAAAVAASQLRRASRWYGRAWSARRGRERQGVALQQLSIEGRGSILVWGAAEHVQDGLRGGIIVFICITDGQ